MNIYVDYQKPLLPVARTESRIGLFAVVLGIVLLFLFGWLTHSFFEAKAFNKATGKSISTWQAMWTDLRIMDFPDEKDSSDAR